MWGGPPGPPRTPTSACVSRDTTEPDQGVRRGRGRPPHQICSNWFPTRSPNATVNKSSIPMGAKEQLALVETFETSRPSNPLFCNQEFLEKVAEHSRDAMGRRLSF